ncbi:MAG: radical SAM protein [Nitrospirae bacterium]|nr:radical SAM protein [Nitrospirota bacterium]
MKVLLISPNREQVPDPAFPLGLAYIASALMRHGHNVRVLDLCFADDAEAAIASAIAGFRPEVIGMSLRNIDDVAYPKQHSYLRGYRETVAAVRRHTTAPLVLGGSGFTIMPEQFMDALGADFGITGEGERAFPRLLKDISSGKKTAEGCIITSRPRITELDEITPDRGLFDTSSYYDLGGMLNIQTKRGCPFRCIYCTYPKVEGRKVRMRDPVDVADELEGVVEKTGARHFFIVDSIFNFPAAHAAAVCSEIISRKLDIQWSCYANPAYMSEELAEVMVRAGCTGVEFGTDSLEDTVLKKLGKNFTWKKVVKASDVCRRSGLRHCHFVFAGAPGDTDGTVRITIERLEELRPDAAVVMAGIRIFPGTVLADVARQDLGIAGPGLEPVFYLSPDVRSYDDITEEVSQKRSWIMPGFEINIHPRLQRKLREHGIRGPLWEELARRKSK